MLNKANKKTCVFSNYFVLGKRVGRGNFYFYFYLSNLCYIHVGHEYDFEQCLKLFKNGYENVKEGD